MKIATYNIHGWRTRDGAPNLDAVARVLGEIDADIVGLNEVFYPRVVPNEAGNDRPALEILAGRLGLHFVFGPCVRWPAQDELPADAYGNALLARWPIVAAAAHHLTPKEPAQAARLDGLETRGLLEGRVILPSGQPFTAYVTHLDHTGEGTRLVQLRTLRQWTVRDRNRPHVVVGDFNAISPHDATRHALRLDELASQEPRQNLTGDGEGLRVVAEMEKAGYVDAFRRAGGPPQNSYIPADWPVRIDYIWLSAPLIDALQSCKIIEEPEGEEASDHRPVVAAFETAKK